LIGRLDEAERALGEMNAGALPPPLATAIDLVAAGIAIRRLQIETARAALGRAERAASQTGITALAAEVENATLVLNTPAARVIARGEERLLLLDQVEMLLRSGALVVDACRRVVRNGGMVISLATRPVLFALIRALGEAWPDDVSRNCLSQRPFGASKPTRPIARDYGSRWGGFASSFGCWRR
jgi:hypothetical protein